MAITQLTTNLNYHQALPDQPNATDGLTPTEIKQRYDQGVNDIKTYINSTLIAALEAITAGASGAHNIGTAPITGVTGADVYAQLSSIKALLDAAVIGTIPDGTLAYAKLNTAAQAIINGKAAIAPTLAPWIAPTLLNAWVNFGGALATAGYYKDDLGMVHIKGMIKSGTITGGTGMLVLPAGYRPSQTTPFDTLSNDLFAQFQIDSAGSLYIINGGNASFSIKCSYRAEQ